MKLLGSCYYWSFVLSMFAMSCLQLRRDRQQIVHEKIDRKNGKKKQEIKTRYSVYVLCGIVTPSPNHCRSGNATLHSECS